MDITLVIKKDTNSFWEYRFTSFTELCQECQESQLSKEQLYVLEYNNPYTELCVTLYAEDSNQRGYFVVSDIVKAVMQNTFSF